MKLIFKKATVLALIASLFFIGCKSSKEGQEVPARKEIKGTWVLNNITVTGITDNAKYNFNLLDEGSIDCLKGSTWKFPNNAFGSYEITASGTGCKPGNTDIVWSYRKESGEVFFLYKKLVDGVKAKNITDGYKFKIVDVYNDAMLLQSEAVSAGQVLTFNYNFTKIK